MKRFITSILAFALAASMLCTSAFASQTTATATYTDAAVTVDGSAVCFTAYNIGGNNYFKLRDIAKTLSGSEKQFEVTWDGSKNAINLVTGKSYTTVGGEMNISLDKTAKSAALSDSAIYMNGQPVSLTAYNIGGNNYFKLRDIGEAIGFDVGWDDATRTIAISTKPSGTSDASENSEEEFAELWNELAECLPNTFYGQCKSGEQVVFMVDNALTAALIIVGDAQTNESSLFMGELKVANDDDSEYLKFIITDDNIGYNYTFYGAPVNDTNLVFGIGRAKYTIVEPTDKDTALTLAKDIITNTRVLYYE